ncbi:MAG: type IV secretion system DNA-binding domain-containing protein [Gammaproteobacteria bacterium]|nr:type IV secretion system DNA-binding domain-containing protein [Gammaproteobacteria bacterium]
MKAIHDLRGLREQSKKIIRAKNAPKENVTDSLFAQLLIGFACLFFGAICAGIYRDSAESASIGAAVGLGLYLTFPLLAWFFSFAQNLKVPPSTFFDKFSPFHKLFSILFFAWLATYWFNHNYYRAENYVTTKYVQLSIGYHEKNMEKNLTKRRKAFDGIEQRHEMGFSHKSDSLLIQSNYVWAFAWFIILLLICSFLERFGKYLQKKENRLEAIEKSDKKESSFKLWLGRSTGMLSEASHGASIAARQNISLSIEDAAQNIIVLGGIGSGKTTRAINPILLQLMDQECGGLIFDIKGNFFESVMSFSEKTGRKIITLGPNFEKINLISDLTPEIASSFLKSIFLLNSKGANDSFWIDTATELCRNTLGVLSFFEEKYTLKGLYSYLFDEEYRKNVDYQIKSLLPTLDENEKTLMAAYARYHTSIFERFDEKVQANVNATVAQVLSPFTHPTLMEAFCTVNHKKDVWHEKTQIKFSSTLDGDIYLVSLPLSMWGLAGKVVYSFIKLSFYNVMQKRNLQKNWNQDRPVFFMCDEFQEIVSANRDGLSDLNFWDKSRSSKTIGIISAQAVSSFYAAIGDRDVSHALLQNFRQKICFRTEDTVTLNYFNSLADRVEVERETKSYTTGSTGSSSSNSETKTITLVDKPVLSPQLFRNLDPNHAIAILSVGGHSMDDVLMMKQVLVEEG